MPKNSSVTGNTTKTASVVACSVEGTGSAIELVGRLTRSLFGNYDTTGTSKLLVGAAVHATAANGGLNWQHYGVNMQAVLWSPDVCRM